jgi:hypothetical protein
MKHVLVDQEYRDASAAARAIARSDALANLMASVLPEWIYVDPKVLARGFRIAESDLVQAIEASGVAKRDGKRFVTCE